MNKQSKIDEAHNGSVKYNNKTAALNEDAYPSRYTVDKQRPEPQKVDDDPLLMARKFWSTISLGLELKRTYNS